jgi:hypothetical protein
MHIIDYFEADLRHELATLRRWRDDPLSQPGTDIDQQIVDMERLVARCCEMSRRSEGERPGLDWPD